MEVAALLPVATKSGTSQPACPVTLRKSLLHSPGSLPLPCTCALFHFTDHRSFLTSRFSCFYKRFDLFSMRDADTILVIVQCFDLCLFLLQFALDFNSEIAIIQFRYASDMKGAKGKGAVKKDSLKPVDDKKVGKRKAPAKAVGKSKGKAGKAAKDPNKPKRPPSAFFVFLEEFRKTFKKENPTVKAVSAVGKAGGEKWKSLSAAEKAPYEAKAAKRKIDYEKLMTAYNKKQDSMADDDEESEKSKSEVDEESGQDGGDDDDEEEDDDEDDD
ncbi:hypothetical protein L2E82_21128 [Cichorium intybus]|uniref:Uncharacterized protein n=1 Tax=Cichorium intybus TaxID=13427 RepID=A0ACB9DVP6_CICIN|nr:hypothetical protein L2E82_21128 [Cichorium intybus]